MGKYQTVAVGNPASGVKADFRDTVIDHLACQEETHRALKLDEIGAEQAAEYASESQRDGLQISSINSCLRCLRRVLKLAAEWRVLTRAPRIKFLPGEHCRDRVLSLQEELLYLNAGSPRLPDVE